MIPDVLYRLESKNIVPKRTALPGKGPQDAVSNEGLKRINS
jgi:hypothetical protein